MRIKIFLLITSLILLFVIIMVVFNDADSIYKHRVDGTKFSLYYLRSMIICYNKEEGIYPKSLAEMQNYFNEKKTNSFRNNNSEYISSKDGCDKEFDSLDGNGGWYYDNNTGLVKVNITKPVNYYLQSKSWFCSSDDEIPSEW